MKIIKEVSEGYPIVRITDSQYSYTYGYYSNNSWIDQNRIVLKKIPNDIKLPSKLVVADLERETEEELLSGKEADFYFTDYVVYGEKIYCPESDKLICLNVNTKEKHEICSIPKGFTFPHITNDGKYINFAVYTKENNIITLSECYIVDTKSGSCEKVFEKKFSKPFTDASHIMICPTDKDKIFFSHEGDTFYISNRLWMYEKGKGMKCIAKQHLDEEQNLADCFGHECWTYDGKGLYFVKYSCSPKGPKGICYVNADGTGQKNAIYGKYPYWHVCTSSGGRFLAADTQSGERSWVCLIDTETGNEIVLAKAGFAAQHPAHPHPCFNTDSTRICYHDLTGDKLTVCIAQISDII